MRHLSEHTSSSYSLTEWLRMLEHRHAEAIQLGLDRVHEVAKRLRLLDLNAIKILVAGTNGKGSTVQALESLYTAAGYRVGAYTSPHLIEFNERIRVNQKNINDDDLCRAFEVIEQARGEIHLTYFEVTTLAALWYFQQSELDVVLLEVGMGGRLDATNIVDADIAIITTIDLDHQAYLGETRELIGYEKAGIMRAKKPVIYADFTPPSSVINHAQELEATLISVANACTESTYCFEVNDSNLIMHLNGEAPRKLPLPTINYQSVAAAIVATHHLQEKLPITTEDYAKALLDTFILGRQQVLEGPITTILDVAHNPQAVSLLSKYIAKNFPNRTVHAVFSGLRDKDLVGIINAISENVDYWYPCLLTGDRALSSEELIILINDTTNYNESTCFHDPLQAYHAAMRRATTGDVVVVFGSFLVVGPVVKYCLNAASFAIKSSIEKGVRA